MDRRQVGIVAAILLVGSVLIGAAVTGPHGTEPRPETSTVASERTADTGQFSSGGLLAFTEVSNKVGLTYAADRAYADDTSRVTNAGAYAVDYNDDGWTDVLLIGGTHPVLFENTGGTFDRSRVLPDIDREIQAALFFDYNADGWPDLLLLSKHRTPLLLENRNGSFRRVDVGFDRPLLIPTGASTADYNGDGCLDLFIIQTGNWSTGPPEGLTDYSVSGRDNGGQNVLFRGNCAEFENVTARADISGIHWSLATSFVDLNGDGRPDIHVANDFYRDALYINRGNGTFERRMLGSFVRRNGRRVLGPRTNRNGMASEVMDMNRDGRLDLFVTNIYVPSSISGVAYSADDLNLTARGNNLFLGRRGGQFVERSEPYRLSKGGWGWAAVAADLDNDGDQDIVHTTMRIRLRPTPTLSLKQIQNLYDDHPYLRYPAVFEQVDRRYFLNADPTRVGLNRSDGRGILQFDFDRDGDLDLLIADANGAFKVYENRVTTGHSLEIDLEGSSRTPAIGARVYVRAENRTQVRVHNARTDFLSQGSRVLHFGIADAERVSIRVVWPDGTIQRFANVRTQQRLVIAPDGIVERTAFNATRSGDQ